MNFRLYNITFCFFLILLNNSISKSFALKLVISKHLVFIKLIQGVLANTILEKRYSEWLSNKLISPGMKTKNYLLSIGFTIVIMFFSVIHYSFPGFFWCPWESRWDGVMVNISGPKIWSYGHSFDYFYDFYDFNLFFLGAVLF